MYVCVCICVCVCGCLCMCVAKYVYKFGKVDVFVASEEEKKNKEGVSIQTSNSRCLETVLWHYIQLSADIKMKNNKVETSGRRPKLTKLVLIFMIFILLFVCL